MSNSVMFEPSRWAKGNRLSYEGRNGFGLQLGIDFIGSNFDRALAVYPVNSLNRRGPCVIKVPFESFDEIVEAMRDAMQSLVKATEKPSSVKALMDANLWGEHPKFKRDEWINEVRNGNVQSGYWDWVQTQVDEVNGK